MSGQILHFPTTWRASRVCWEVQCSTSPSWSRFWQLQYGQVKVKRFGTGLRGRGREREHATETRSEKVTARSTSAGRSPDASKRIAVSLSLDNIVFVFYTN
ncbi:hypothetical protein EYF80_044924 [Liparis tanakae]|uniref:Uncharacterized protein n=1 Tax=Liparis tanakae TaxID=230148 RepID=A0A4Z2FWA1_9TELE|nr:hypothetical protein EYF80_044924 [Liparis tanakae]